MSGFLDAVYGTDQILHGLDLGLDLVEVVRHVPHSVHRSHEVLHRIDLLLDLVEVVHVVLELVDWAYEQGGVGLCSAGPPNQIFNVRSIA